MINDGKQTDRQLQNKIMQSADSSRSSYATTASNVSKLGLLAPDAFKSNDEIIKFSELLNKSFKVGGASTQEQDAGTYQLTQAMAAGKLQGDEFRSVMENAPLVAQAIADYTGKTKGELKEMSSQGTITADIIKNAMFASAKQIEDRYKKMPKTFADYWTMIKNKAVRSFTPIIEKINEMINTPQFEEFFNKMCVGIQLAAETVNLLINGLTWLYQTLEPFAPLIGAVVAALIAYKTYTILAATAQNILNGAMLLNPAGIFVAALVAVIAILGYLWVTNDKVAYALLEAWDRLVIGAMFFALGFKQGIYEIIIAGLSLYSKFLVIKFGLQAIFYETVLSAQRMALGFTQGFEDIVNGGTWMYNKIAELLNKLGASFQTIDYANFTSGIKDNISKTMGDYAKSIAETKGQMQDVNTQIENYQKELQNIKTQGASDIWNKFKENERTRDERVANRNNWLNDIEDKINGALDLGNSVKNKIEAVPVKSVGGKLDGAGEVNISDEDLKYLKDFAEQEFVNKFTSATLAPNVTVTFGDIHETADADAIKGRIAQILEEEIAEVAEGVYS